MLTNYINFWGGGGQNIMFIPGDNPVQIIFEEDCQEGNFNNLKMHLLHPYFYYNVQFFALER